ncbi:MAG: 2-oxoacid:ferredoxin oxidoreductase subunit beta [bacterium]
MPAKRWNSDDPPAWCPGCGNFGIREGVKLALEKLGLEPHQLAFVSGIGQAAKAPHYLRCNLFNGLHGRTMPVATGLKLARPDLTVICEGGDGDGYAEGGNHFLHALRRNLDLTYLVHDNQIYGLTKGQASPTSDLGMKTATTPFGVRSVAFNPLALAVALDAGFVARGFAGNPGHLAGLIVEAVRHPGFALVEILQNCVSFNKVNTAQWYRERVYELDRAADAPQDRAAAFRLAREWGDRIPIGIIYRSGRPAYPAPVRDRPADPDELLARLLDDLD